jgi:asparagine synthase (glutamine-hydrolysing)
MCGIAGYYSPRAPRRGAQLALRMLRSIEHRGPDDQGLVFFDMQKSLHMNCATNKSARDLGDSERPAAAGVDFPHHASFSHCRYSIIDLTPGGHQPMWDFDGKVCVSFNGEIYNYVELREELERAGLQFRTRSDTEVLLAGYVHWGVDVFRRLNGQWALSLLDIRDGRLLLSRDRLGKVPLYYTVQGQCFYWASEIKALREACGAAAFTVRAQAVDEFVVEGWRDRDGTFWNEVHDFPPASFAWIDDDLKLEITRYWQLPARRLSADAISSEEAAARIRELLLDAVRVRIRADVPVAFELSGGMDSSSLVALAAGNTEGSLTTYSVEFAEQEYNEEPFARAVADRFAGKIDYRVIRPSAEDFWRDADQFVWLEEEPFHAPNLHTNQSLRRRMREGGTKVVITGAAGDEVFAGYHGEYFSAYLRYLAGRFAWRRLAHELRANTEYEPSLRSFARISLDVMAPGLRERLQRARSAQGRLLQVCYSAPAGAVRNASVPSSLGARMSGNMGAAKMNYWLRSANKANFGIPIEPRAPFLDYKLVDFAFTLPFEYLIRDGWHKWLLRKAMTPLLPAQVLWRRRKMGFPFPMADWLITSKPRIQDALADSECPYLDRSQLLQGYEDFARSAPFALWRLASLGLWWRRVVEDRPLASSRPT